MHRDIVCLAFVVGAAVFFPACNPGQGDHVSVASYTMFDPIAELHIVNVLTANEIEFITEGWGGMEHVSVAYRDRALAERLLNQSLANRINNICLGERFYGPAEGDWGVAIVNRPISELLEDVEFSDPAGMGAVLNHWRTTAASRTFSSVGRVKTLKREYQDEKGDIQIGHEYLIDFIIDPDEDIAGKRVEYLVWNDGKEVQGAEYTEWWHGDPETIAANKKKLLEKAAAESATAD